MPRKGKWFHKEILEMWIKAIYRIPELKHIFLVTSPHEILESDVTKDEFERILLMKGTNKPQNKTWITKTIQEDDFLESINNLEVNASPNLTSQKPTNMELLSVNILNNNKNLSTISEEDVIDILI